MDDSQIFTAEDIKNITNAEQQFLKDLDNKLWTSAHRLRNALDAANYKHVVLGIIFLKYVSDTFEERQNDLRRLFTEDSPLPNGEDNIYHMPRDYHNSDAEYQEAISAELELHEYYQENNVFWVPKQARWDFLKSTAALAIGSEIEIEDGEIFKLTSISKLIDNALEAIETHKIDNKLANPKLKGVLPRVGGYDVDNHNLTELINKFSDTSFHNPEYNGVKLDLHSKDILGHVYEYFLGQFALAEGKQGGQYYTPKSIVTLIVEMLQPYQGRVYDPAMGAGGFFVSNDKFIDAHAKEKHYNVAEQRKHISVYGQESNPTTWRLAAMNMAIRGIDFNFGKKNADSFLNDQHPDLRADYVMANPPFNIKDWWHTTLENDVRWKYGKPPAGNANYGWIQHMLYHLNDNGSMGLLLANGSMSSNTNNEGEIRKALIEADLVECMVALPGQLFTNTQIPACIWFLTKNKKGDSPSRQGGKRDRCGEALFIDARNLGFMKDRVLRDFEPEDIANIANTFHQWRREKAQVSHDSEMDKSDQKGDVHGNANAADGTAVYQDEKGFCYSASIDDMKKHDYVLTPGRYVGVPEQDEDNEPFPKKMQRLTAQLKGQFKKSERLKKEIKENLAGIGYEL
jgi:type I restriction enzyme M protein